MTITHSYTKLVAVAAGVAVAFALVLGAAAPVRAAALTSGQISSIIGLLQSFGADAATIANVQASLNGTAPTAPTAPTMPTTPSTGGSMACNAAIGTQDLTVGSTGVHVMALQKFLNMSAATQVAATGAGSPGMETSTFGPATKAAVIKFQTANAITPAAGYVGPVTRTTIAAKCSGTTPTTPGTPTTPTTPSGLKGGEGTLEINDTLGDVEGDLDEGDEDVKVLGLELEAKDSDISVQRIDVQFDLDDATGGESTQLDDYISEVSLMLDGKVLATMDVDEIDEDSSESDLYEARFTGLNGIIREGKTADLYVVVSAVNNIDTGDVATVLEVGIPASGIRAIDAMGISETYDGGYTGNGGGDLETFTVSASDTGTLDITEGDKNPEAGIVVANDTTDTNDVTVLEFDLKANDQDITITDLPVGIAVSGATNVGDIVKRATLYKGSTSLKSKTIPASAGAYEEIVFTDVNIDIQEGDTETFTVKLDINKTDSGEPDNSDTVVASTTESLVGWDVEDANGENVNPDGSVGGNTQTFYLSNGIQVNYKDSSTKKTSGANPGTPDSADFTIKFSVKNLGDDDIYFDGDVTAAGVATAAKGVTWATTTDATTGTTTGTYGYGTGILSANDGINTNDGDTDDSSDKRFKIKSDEIRDFTFNVTINAGGDNVVAAAKLSGFAWDTTSQDTMTNLYNFDLGSFHTDPVTGLNIQ